MNDWLTNILLGVNKKYELVLPKSLHSTQVPYRTLNSPLYVQGQPYYNYIDYNKAYNSPANVRERYADKDAAFRLKYSDRDYTIPFIKDKQIRLSNAGKSTTAKFSTNMLDSIVNSAIQAGLDPYLALGLVAQESEFGNGRNGIGCPIKETNLISNWRYRDTPYIDAEIIALKKAGKAQADALVRGANYDRSEQIYDSVYNKVLLDGERYADRRAKYLLQNIPANPLVHGFSSFLQNPFGYNPGDPDYPNKVKRNAAALKNSPEIQLYFTNRNKTNKQ